MSVVNTLCHQELNTFFSQPLPSDEPDCLCHDLSNLVVRATVIVKLQKDKICCSKAKTRVG
jgi:hypothetical protein